MNLKGNFIS
ncbi:hypothetical protein CP8484711_0687A, partial [Chlamydia psittaci 84-8471/1]